MDTVKIRKDWVESCFGFTMTIDKGTYLINDVIIDKESFYFIKNRIDSIDNIIDNNTDSYFIFLLPDNKTVVQEGRWSKEFNFGYWKYYYSNGKIKEEGYYTELCDSTYYPGQKIGKWKYYYENGKIKETKYHYPQDRRIKSEPTLILPPCTCNQKMLYKKKDCITVPQARLKGATFFYSSDAIFDKKNKDSLYELAFLKKYASIFMDSMYSKNKCINECVFAIKIFKHNSNDTVLEFSIEYIQNEKAISYLNLNNYISVKNRKVLVKFTSKLKNDKMRSYLPILEKDEKFEKYFPSQLIYNEDSYRGIYKLHGNLIEATISPPWYGNIPSGESITSD